MKLTEVTEATLDPMTSKKMAKVTRAFTNELKRFDKKAKVEVKAKSPFEVSITSDLTHWMHPTDIKAMWEDMTDAVKKADDNGHIFNLEEYGSGEEFVEALLSGLKPGMTVRAEAFFPMVGFTIKWKQIVSTKSR